MPLELLKQARRDRNTALIDVMVLAASADGDVTKVELKNLLARVIERPEFEGVNAAEISGLVETSARRLGHARGLEDVLKVLKQRLPGHRNRLLAFGLATSVAMADRKTTRDELTLLKSFQQAFALSEADVAKVFDAVERGAPLAEVLGEPLEQLYAEVMVLVSAADGEVSRAEADAILENLAANPVFRETSADLARGYLRDALENLRTWGLPARLTALAQGLSTKKQRARAWALATRVAHAHPPAPATLRTLELLQATFGLNDEEAARLAMES